MQTTQITSRNTRAAVVVEFTVNGAAVRVDTSRHRTLLQALREELKLTGTKYGCGKGQCGACTVLLDGMAVRSCVTSLAAVKNKTVMTIEGLAANGTLHPVQQAFVDIEAMQCGYCTPGMILGTIALLNDKPDPSRDDIRAGLNGHLCRCCNYRKIEDAVHHAAALLRKG